MKFYRVLDMTLRKYNKEQKEFKVGSQGSFGGIMTSLDECIDIMDKAKRNELRGIDYSKVKILKDEITEFQIHTIDNYGESIYCIKIVEMDINI